MKMLSHPVLKRNQSLTDKLLKLLGLIANNLPESFDPSDDFNVDKHVSLNNTTASLNIASTSQSVASNSFGL